MTPNQPIEFSTKKFGWNNDDSHGTYNTNSQTKFEISMVKLNLCDYNDAYIHVKRTIKGVGDDAAAREEDEKIKE